MDTAGKENAGAVALKVRSRVVGCACTWMPRFVGVLAVCSAQLIAATAPPILFDASLATVHSDAPPRAPCLIVFAVLLGGVSTPAVSDSLTYL